MDIGEKLRKLRREKNLSQSQIAEKLGVILDKRFAYQQVSSIENGTRSVRLPEIKALAIILGVDEKELTDYKGPMPFFKEDGFVLIFEGEHPSRIIKENGILKVIYGKGNNCISSRP